MNHAQFLDIQARITKGYPEPVSRQEIVQLAEVAERFFKLRKEVWQLTKQVQDGDFHSVDDVSDELLEISVNKP